MDVSCFGTALLAHSPVDVQANCRRVLGSVGGIWRRGEDEQGEEKQNGHE